MTRVRGPSSRKKIRLWLWVPDGARAGQRKGAAGSSLVRDDVERVIACISDSIFKGPDWIAQTGASWFETRDLAALLTLRGKTVRRDSLP